MPDKLICDNCGSRRMLVNDGLESLSITCQDCENQVVHTYKQR